MSNVIALSQSQLYLIPTELRRSEWNIDRVKESSKLWKEGLNKERVRFEDSDDDDTFDGIINLFMAKIIDGERVDRRLEKDVSERLYI